ncbi:MAG: YggS family pyridoxal phosphate-dependent enzyme [Acidobacteriaceae bacterium]|nr:YggS family pyridoxal phosphate-dependent enzyme [Acidobacteriaceae bacterium]
MSTIRKNLERVRNQMEEACHRAGRPSQQVRLMAVSKTHPADALLEAMEAGQHLFGENRVQEWQTKQEALAGKQVEMHLIGPLQSNKTTRAVETFSAIDSLDSLRIAARLESTAASLDKFLPVLIEVKLSHETSKHGLSPDALPSLLSGLKDFPHLQACGLMTVPPYSEDPADARPYFARLRALRDQNLATSPKLTELSMGMSHDFAVAIEEGSTCIRIGTAIFGNRSYPQP